MKKILLAVTTFLFLIDSSQSKEIDIEGEMICKVKSNYVVEINETGISALVQFSAGITGLEVGDEIGVFDSAGLTNFNDCSSQIGEILVASGVWAGDQLDLVGIGSVDLCSSGGIQLPGYIDGNDIVIKVWRNGSEFDSVFETSVGGAFGDLFTVLTSITLIVPVEYDIVINEFFFRSDASDTPDYVELYNAGAEDVDLAGWTLAGEVIGGGTISAGGYFPLLLMIHSLMLMVMNIMPEKIGQIVHF